MKQKNMDVLDSPCPSGAGHMWPLGRVAMCGLVLALALAACTQTNRAPVEDRTAVRTTTPATPALPPPAGVPRASGPVVTGDGWRTVQPGDTLVRIGLETGNSWKDLARWNQMDNPDVLTIGQVIRVLPPPGDTATEDPSGVEVSPVGNDVGNGVPGPAWETSPVVEDPLPPSVPPSAPPAIEPSPPAAPVSARVARGTLAWPARGQVLSRFNSSATLPGIDIGGQAGDPVYAAADGKVIYAGADLPGYGRMIILQHNETYLSSYGHNSKLLVKDEQQVKKGQKIAEMGDTHADRVKLHFQLRHKGVPVDPQPFLSPRP